MTSTLPVAQVRKVSNESTLTPADETVLRMIRKCDLRMSDELVLLPGAYHSPESLSLKNVVLRLNGDEPGIPVRAFSSWWCHGISAVRVPSAEVEKCILSKSAQERQAMTKLLCDSIPNEVSDRDVIVGPKLSVDSDERDTEEWAAGFDTKNGCIGLYACEEERQSDGAPPGTQRAHRQYYLVCKAGAGRAAQEFSGKIEHAAREGKTLNDFLTTEGGEETLRRVAQAGRRNRARLLLTAANVLGIAQSIDSVIDHASALSSGGTMKQAILHIDVHCNTLAPIKGQSRTDWVYYAGCIATGSAQGLICANTANLGFVMLHTADAEGSGSMMSGVLVSNDAHNAIPFGTPRLASTNDVLHMACTNEHPDAFWLAQRFAWKNVASRFANVREAEKLFASRVAHVEPPQLWGTHMAETWVQASARELGVSTYCVTKLRPEMVVLAGTEPEKMRALMRTVTRPDANRACR